MYYNSMSSIYHNNLHAVLQWKRMFKKCDFANTAVQIIHEIISLLFLIPGKLIDWSQALLFIEFYSELVGNPEFIRNW